MEHNISIIIKFTLKLSWTHDLSVKIEVDLPNDSWRLKLIFVSSMISGFEDLRHLTAAGWTSELLTTQESFVLSPTYTVWFVGSSTMPKSENYQVGCQKLRPSIKVWSKKWINEIISVYQHPYQLWAARVGYRCDKKWNKREFIFSQNRMQRNVSRLPPSKRSVQT